MHVAPAGKHLDFVFTLVFYLQLTSSRSEIDIHAYSGGDASLVFAEFELADPDLHIKRILEGPKGVNTCKLTAMSSLLCFPEVYLTVKMSSAH